MKKSANEIISVYTKHSLAIRWTHWLNFPLLTLMLISGVMIYWANDVYTPFIPDTFYKMIGFNQKLALGLAIHFFFMWIFLINGLVYAFYLLFSGSWREIVPNLSTFKDAVLVTLHDFGFKKTLPPQGKFNGGQKLAYSGVAFLGFLQILTGLVIYKPVQLQTLLSLFGGYQTARLVHFIVTVLFSLFFIVHLIQVLRAGWNNVRSMVTGTEEITKSEIQQAQGLKND